MRCLALSQTIRKVARCYVKPFAVVGVSTPILSRLNPILERITVSLAPEGEVHYQNETIEGVRCERTIPSEHSDLTIIYFHGGGFQFGSPKGHRNITTRLALKTKAQIVSVDYTLGGYGPAEREASKVCKSMVAAGGRFMVAGDSAGGNLALHCAHLYGDKLEAVVCISPWVDLRKHSPVKGDPLISAVALNAASYRYLGSTDPIKASQYDCKDSKILETQLICHYCEDEILGIGIRKLIKNMEVEGKSPVVREYKNLFHVFQILGGIIPEANQAMNNLAEDILSSDNVL